ncbi:MAG: LptE family protein [Thermodesulfobacteriota bacterium]
MLFIVCGCSGYRMASTTMPGEVTSVYVPFFKNSTQRPGVETVLTNAVIDEFTTTVDIVDKGRAEAVLEGTVMFYELKPVSYSTRDVVREYRLTITLAMKLVRASDGEVLWEDDEITDYGDYVVDIEDVTATKDAEWDALRKMARDTARLVKERMLERF